MTDETDNRLTMRLANLVRMAITMRMLNAVTRKEKSAQEAKVIFGGEIERLETVSGQEEMDAILKDIPGIYWGMANVPELTKEAIIR